MTIRHQVVARCGLILKTTDELTFDKDFGELVFRRGAKASHGVVLFRIAQPSAVAVAARVAAVLASRADWSGHFSVVEEFTIWMRLLPNG